MSTQRKLSYDDFLKWWWKAKFPEAKPPTWHAAITCSDATDLLRSFELYLKQQRTRRKS